MAEDNRKLDTGDVVGDFEVVGVQYQETPEGERVNFTYLIKDQVKAVKKATPKKSTVKATKKGKK